MLVALSVTLMLMSPPALKGEALLDDLAKRAVRYFWEQSEPSTGLALDRAPNSTGAESTNGNIASIASTGYALAACAIGAERGWLPRGEVLARARLTVQSILRKVEGTHGWYYHFVDWKTGKRQWKCELSSIDSGLLFAGMLMADAGLKDPEFSRLTKQVLDRIDWKWMLTDGGEKPESLSFTMGWKPEEGFEKGRWGAFSEHMFLYVLAYGLWPDMPAGAWDAWERPVIVHKGSQLMVGGPLFLHQMSAGFVDFRGLRDAAGWDYFVEARNATLANRHYCIDNPQKFAGYGPDIWGLSACDFPDGYNAQGAPGWISDNGTLAPAAAVASVLFTPSLSMSAAEAFVSQYPESYGRYGFVTGLNPSKKWTGKDVIGIDLGQLLLLIEAHRDGLPYRWMESRTDYRAAMKRIGFRKTSEGALEGRALRLPRGG